MMKRGAITALILVAVVISYALVVDLLNGLPFTRSSPSWLKWAGGLFALGVGGLLVEAASELAFGARDPWERGRGRIFRMALAMFLLLVVVGACVV